MGQYGYFKLKSICSFYTDFFIIVGNFYVSLLTLKSIFSFSLMQSEKEKEEQKWFNQESKGEHLHIREIFIVYNFARQTISRVLSLKLIISLGLKSLLSSSN